MENMSINQALENSLNNENAASIATDSLEIIFDQVLDEGLLKEIPVVGWLFSGAKIVMSIKDRLYIKKLLKFISSTDGVSEAEREKFFSELSKHQEEKDRLFEKILLTIDRLDDVQKSEYVGRAFMHLLKGDITKLEYYRMSLAIEDILLDDLRLFLLKYKPLSLNQEGKVERKFDTSKFDLYKGTSQEELTANLIKTGILQESIVLNQPNSRTGSDLPILKRQTRCTTVGNLLLEMEYNTGLHFPRHRISKTKT